MERVIIVAFTIVVLLVCAAVVFRVVEQIFRDVYSIRVETHILKLNPKLLPVRTEKFKIFANQTEVILVFSLFQLPPSVGDLRAFKSRSFEKRFRVFNFFAIHSEEDVMMDGLGTRDGRGQYHRRQRVEGQNNRKQNN